MLVVCRLSFWGFCFSEAKLDEFVLLVHATLVPDHPMKIQSFQRQVVIAKPSQSVGHTFL